MHPVDQMKKISKSGFTLIELLMVMLLMVLVTTITVSGSFGMSRAASYTAAQDVVYNTLQNARQKACLDGKRVFVVLQDNETMLVVEGVGTVTGKGTGGIYDRTATFRIPQPTSSRPGPTVWNLSTGAHVKNVFTRTANSNNEDCYWVEDEEDIPCVDESQDGRFSDFRFGYRHCNITVSSGNPFSSWNIGDAYGFEVMPAKKMPKGFRIGLGGVQNAPDNAIIVFSPDGTGGLGIVQSSGITVGSGDVHLYVSEKIAGGDANKAIHIVISEGIISVE